MLTEKTFLLFRTLLTQGNCFSQNGRNLMFYSNVLGTLRNRNENWRRFFKNKLHFINKIINNSLFNKQDVITSLNRIIDDDTQNLKEDYLIKFILNPALLDYAKKRCIRKINEGYYILGSTRIFGYYVELFTYDWYLKNKNSNITYLHAKSEDEIPCLEIKINKTLFYIELNSETAEFDLVDKQNNIIDSFSNIDEAFKNINTSA